jgi:hypothetical protein
MSRLRIPHFRKLVFFVALSFADGFLTWQLLSHNDGRVYESNPIASAWLSAWGWSGLFLFKAATVLVVIGAALCITRSRPQTGGRLLSFGCLAVAAVVGYSCFLSGVVQGQGAQPILDDNQLAKERLCLEQELKEWNAYALLRQQLVEDLLSQRCTLSQAMTKLADQSPKAKNGLWLRRLHQCYPGHSDSECLALHLIMHSLLCLDLQDAVGRFTARMQTEFQAIFGRALVVDFDRAYRGFAGSPARTGAAAPSPAKGGSPACPPRSAAAL